MTQYINKKDMPSILIDNARNITMTSLGTLDDASLDNCLKTYRCNTQVAAMMANVGDILTVPDGVKSKFAGKALKISLFEAWREVYRAALSEQEARQRRLTLF